MYFVAHAFVFMAKNLLQNLTSWRFINICFLLKAFWFLALIFMWLTHFELIFICSKIGGLSILHVNIHLSQHHLWRDCYFPHWIVLELVKYQLATDIFGFIAGFSILCLCFMCLAYAITMIIILLWPCSKFWNF